MQHFCSSEVPVVTRSVVIYSWLVVTRSIVIYSWLVIYIYPLRPTLSQEISSVWDITTGVAERKKKFHLMNRAVANFILPFFYFTYSFASVMCSIVLLISNRCFTHTIATNHWHVPRNVHARFCLDRLGGLCDKSPCWADSTSLPCTC